MPLFDRWTAPLSAERQALELLPEHIEGFRRSQRLAYDCAEAVEKLLREGITELQTVGLMSQYLADHGVREHFHIPFAWFGDRTAFTNFRTDAAFAPTERRLRPGDAVILDVAPVVDGHAADIGYSCALGDNPVQQQMARDLVEYRELILEGVKAGRTRSAIYRDLDRRIELHGYENRHQRYPNRVLGHRVTWQPPHERSERVVGGFGWATMRVALAANVMTRFAGLDSVEWNDLATSDKVPGPGLWAVEPHIGFMGTGAKWEELLVVTGSGEVYWIDDDVPHLKRLQRPSVAAPKRAPAVVNVEAAE